MRTIEEIISQLTATDMGKIKASISDYPSVKSSIASGNVRLVDYDINTLERWENETIYSLDRAATNFLVSLQAACYRYSNNTAFDAGRKNYKDVLDKYFTVIRDKMSQCSNMVSTKATALSNINTSINSVKATDTANETARVSVQEKYKGKTIDVIAKEAYDAELQEAILAYAQQILAAEIAKEAAAGTDTQ